MIDYSFDEELLKIDFFKKHKSYLPFVGTNYSKAKLKILHIGNCHYIESSQDPENRYGYTFFKNNWFQNTNDPLPSIYDLNKQMSQCKLDWKAKNLTCKNAWNEYAINTRSVLLEQLTGIRNPFNLIGKSKYELFSFITKILSEVAGEYFWGKPRIISGIHQPVDNSNSVKKPETFNKRKKEYELKLKKYKEDMDGYTYVAFTDFHMIPSLVRGDAYVKNSLISSAQKENISKNDANDFYDEVVKKSSEIIDKIVEILKPDLILITSKPSGEQYYKYTSIDKGKIICLPHPNAIRSIQDKDNYKKTVEDKIKETNRTKKKEKEIENMEDEIGCKVLGKDSNIFIEHHGGCVPTSYYLDYIITDHSIKYKFSNSPFDNGLYIKKRILNSNYELLINVLNKYYDILNLKPSKFEDYIMDAYNSDWSYEIGNKKVQNASFLFSCNDNNQLIIAEKEFEDIVDKIIAQ